MATKLGEAVEVIQVDIQVDTPASAQEDTSSEKSVPTSSTELERLVSETKRFALKPVAFFVSWQGVLTLAYRGFPDSLLNLKAMLAEHHGALPRENPGSRWPKTSLGCLKDNKRLTPKQLDTLLTLCREGSGFFQVPQCPRAQGTLASEPPHNPGPPAPPHSPPSDTVPMTVMVDKLNLVVFECRSLERRLSNHTMELQEEGDFADPCPAELARTDKVLAEAEAEDYWVFAAKDGNREAHYRGPALGATLVHDLQAFKPSSTTPYGSQLPGIVKRFRDRVEQELPGMYTWFADDSLHVTIRGICG